MANVDPLIAPEESCATAEDLLDKLVPHHSGWKNEAHCWIYRGESHDRPLLAKAHRDPKVFDGFGVDLTPHPGESARKVRDRVEVSLINSFVTELDLAGIEVPYEHPRGRRGVITRGLFTSRDFQPVSDEVCALAQHHGIPTSMLDWSRHSLKAAYFAAASAAREPNDEKLVVWAFRRDVIDERLQNDDLAIVTPPQWTNRNLFAQAGTFTHFTLDEITPLDAYLPRVAKEHPYVKVPHPWMRKLSAARTCAPKLLRLLASFGITGASMYPGHEGVIRAMKERALWDLP